MVCSATLSLVTDRIQCDRSSSLSVCRQPPPAIVSRNTRSSQLKLYGPKAPFTSLRACEVSAICIPCVNVLRSEVYDGASNRSLLGCRRPGDICGPSTPDPKAPCRVLMLEELAIQNWTGVRANKLPLIRIIYLS